MAFFSRFTKLMKSEPVVGKRKMRNSAWTIDESKCLTFDEVKRLRDFCESGRITGLQSGKFTPIRNWFMIELGLNAGLRVQEIASLKHSNLLLDGDRSSLLVVGKRNKKRSIWINSEFKKTCEAYLEYKKSFGYQTHDDAYLLNNLKGGAISKRALQKFFKSIAKRAGLPTHYHIHNLRHTYSTFFLKASQNNYRFLQDQLGHSSITTTQVYAAVVESEGRKALEKLYR